jgi:hypothetical protein
MLPSAMFSRGRAADDLVVDREDMMRANAGDELIIKGRHVGDADRKAVIVEVHGGEGAPPYRVRWSDGHESLFFPSSDTVVEHHPGGSRQGSQTP